MKNKVTSVTSYATMSEGETCQELRRLMAARYKTDVDRRAAKRKASKVTSERDRLRRALDLLADPEAIESLERAYSRRIAKANARVHDLSMAESDIDIAIGACQLAYVTKSKLPGGKLAAKLADMRRQYGLD